MTTVETPRQVVATATADAALAAGKHTPVDATAAARTMTLPTGVNPGAHLSVAKTDATANTVTISGSIRSTTGTYVLTAQYESVTFVADPGGSWWPTSAGQPASGIAGTYATLTGLAAKADLVGGVVPTAQIPALALTTAVTVASQSAMLALTTSQVQPGDVAVRTDGAGTFILTAADPSVLGNWTRLNAPTDAVTSVNGHTGTVVLAASDVGVLPATTSAAGIATRATNTLAVGGTDDATFVTPLGTKSAIDARNYTAVTIDGTAQPTLAVSSTAISATDVGLGNVTNTSDANKPVSTAQQAALDLKQDKSLTIVTFTNLTIDTSHAGKLLNCTNASAATLSVPLNSAAAFPIGTTVNIYVSGAGQLTIGWTAGVTVNSRGNAYKSVGQFAVMMLTKVDTDTWVLTGDVSVS